MYCMAKESKIFDKKCQLMSDKPYAMNFESGKNE